MTPNDCANEALYDSLKHCKGTTVLPGLRPHVYYIPKSDIVTWPTRTNVADTGATMKKLGQLTGDFVLAAEKKWHKGELPLSRLERRRCGFLPSG